MSELAPDTMVVTGLGMCSSLGGAITACAAARAGISAGVKVDDLLVRDADGVEEKGTGHPVQTLSGFQGSARLFCLASAALEDLLETTGLRAHGFDRTGLVLALADLTGGRPRAPADHSARPSGGSPLVHVASAGPGILSRLVQRAALDLPDGRTGHVDEGRTSIVRAVSDAAAKLRSGEWHRALIGGVDSLLDGPMLASLADDERLKTPTRPDGMAPGEAGAFLLVERLDMARRRSAPVLAVVGAACLATEAVPPEPRPPSSGAALAEAASRVLAPDSRSAWLISDHNGEYRRASELGSALARLGQRAPGLVAGRRWLPAACFGDTGAAAAAIAAAMATRAFARRYAPAASAVVVASEDGRCGALRIDGPEGAR